MVQNVYSHVTCSDFYIIENLKAPVEFRTVGDSTAVRIDMVRGLIVMKVEVAYVLTCIEQEAQWAPETVWMLGEGGFLTCWDHIQQVV